MPPATNRLEVEIDGKRCRVNTIIGTTVLHGDWVPLPITDNDLLITGSTATLQGGVKRRGRPPKDTTHPPGSSGPIPEGLRLRSKGV